MKPTLPRTGACERFAALREVLDKPAFVAALDGAGVLIRLDERGGDDEPVPWAFHGSGLPLPVQIPSTESDEVFLDRTPMPRTVTAEGAPLHQGVSAGDSTLTGPAFSLSIPPARGRATVHVLPKQEEIVIGRDVRSDVRVNERSISKRHARVVLENPSVPVAGPGGRARPNAFVVDLGSQNGTRVNGTALVGGVRQPMLSGDVVDLGDVALLFLDVAGFYDGLPRLCSG